MEVDEFMKYTIDKDSSENKVLEMMMEEMAVMEMGGGGQNGMKTFHREAMDSWQ